MLDIVVHVRTKTWEVKQLHQLLVDMGEKQSGAIEITDGPSPNTLSVTVKGSASCVYSVYSPFFNAENHLTESSVDGQTIGKFTIILGGLKQKLQERNSLKFVEDYLQLQGFEIEEGGKPSPRVFPESQEFVHEDKVAFKKRFGISLNLANQLHGERDSRVSMPFAFAASTSDIALKDDLNFCFRELGLVASNGQPKECIDLRTGCFLANIGSSQAIDLERHFQQRAMLLAKADAAMLRAVKEAGGPVRAIDKSRASLMSQLEGALPRVQEAPMQLMATCLGNPARLVNGSAALSQEEFVRKLERVMNDNLMIGPSSLDFFLSPELLSMGSGAAAASIPSSPQSLARLLSSLALEEGAGPMQEGAGLIPHKADYLRQYPMLDANSNIAFQLRALDPRRVEDERQSIVKASGLVSSRLEQMRQFRMQHSPFYLVQQISDKLRYLLQGAKEDKIAEILITLGLNEEQMSVYRIVGPNLSRFNVYHIEFMLPVLVLHFCMQNAMILRPQCTLPAGLQQYLYDPYNQTTGSNNESAWRALEWSYNAAFGCGWRAGESRTFSYNTSYGRFFGGSTNTEMGSNTTPPPVKKTTTPSTYTSS
jgi:hypothetical protein